IGVVVRVEHGMDKSDLFAQQLGPQIGRSVDQQISFRQTQRQRTSHPLVLRIGAGADLTAAANTRHPDRCAGTKKDQLAANVSGGRLEWQGQWAGGRCEQSGTKKKASEGL